MSLAVMLKAEAEANGPGLGLPEDVSPCDRPISRERMSVRCREVQLEAGSVGGFQWKHEVTLNER